MKLSVDPASDVPPFEQVREGTGDEVSAAAVRLSTELLSLAPVLRRSPLQALARLHTVAAAGTVADDRLGRPRDAEAAELLRTVAGMLSADAPALVVAADEAVAARLVSAPTVELRPSVPNRPLLLAVLAVSAPMAALVLGACAELLAAGGAGAAVRGGGEAEAAEAWQRLLNRRRQERARRQAGGD